MCSVPADQPDSYARTGEIMVGVNCNSRYPGYDELDHIHAKSSRVLTSMKKMNRAIWVALAASSVSCGGGGISPPIPPGHYTGTWNAPGYLEQGETGIADIMVANDGTITGSMSSSVYGPDGTARGFMLADGRTSMNPVWWNVGGGSG